MITENNKILFYFSDIWYCCWTGGCQRQRGLITVGTENDSSISKCRCSRFLSYLERWACIQCNSTSQSVCIFNPLMWLTIWLYYYHNRKIKLFWHKVNLNHFSSHVVLTLLTGRRLSDDKYESELTPCSTSWRKNMESQDFLTQKVRKISRYLFGVQT